MVDYFNYATSYLKKLVYDDFEIFDGKNEVSKT